MAYGYMSDEQRDRIQAAVTGRVVHDLGAGELHWSRVLLQMGATQVIAIDKREVPKGYEAKEGEAIRFTQSMHTDYVYDHPDEVVDVVFMCWPYNFPDPGQLELVRRAQTIVYLGSNLNGDACGSKELFEYFLTRKAEAYLHTHKNRLIVLEASLSEDREPLPEEQGGLDHSQIHWA